MLNPAGSPCRVFSKLCICKLEQQTLKIIISVYDCRDDAANKNCFNKIIRNDTEYESFGHNLVPVPIYVAMGLPIAIFILTEFIREIHIELTEAGIIDGAGRFKVFTLIIIPLLRPALATVAIYNLVPFWNDLWFPLIFITDEDSKTLLLGVTRLFGQYQTDWSKVLAVLTLSAILVILLYLAMS